MSDQNEFSAIERISVVFSVADTLTEEGTPEVNMSLMLDGRDVVYRAQSDTLVEAGIDFDDDWYFDPNSPEACDAAVRRLRQFLALVAQIPPKE